MKTSVPPLQPGSTPGTFRVAGWRVFRPGFHKGQLYTPADCAAAVRNFAAISAGDAPALRVKAKFGHDAEQRIAKSLGVMNVGRVTACESHPDGGFAIDVDGIPETLLVPDESGEAVAFDLKGAFEAGNICDGSVELVWDTYPDPADPTRMLAGPVLEAVAFLGEERPGVGGLPPPAKTFAARSTDNRSAPRKRRVVFSEVDPMPTRDQLLQQLTAAGVDVSDPTVAAMTDDQLAMLAKTVGGDTFAAAMKAKYAAPPAVPNPATNGPPAAAVPPTDPKDMDAFAATCRKFMDDMTGRMGSMEQAMQATQGQAQMAAQFAADFQGTVQDQQKQLAGETVARAVADGRLSPYARDVTLTDLLKCPNGRRDVFAAGHAAAGRTPFQAACADLLARPVTYLFDDRPDPTPADDTLTPFQRKALDATPTGKRAARSLAAE